MKQKRMQALALVLAAAAAMPNTYGISAENSDSKTDVSHAVTAKAGNNGFTSIESTIQNKQTTVQAYEPNEIVTMIVELDGQALLDQKGQKQTMKEYLATSQGAQASRKLETQKTAVINSLKKERGGNALQVEYSYNVIMNGFSVKAPYSMLETIANTEGVKSVRLSRTYAYEEPVYGYSQVAHSSGEMIDSDRANAEGYTGKGVVTAILDTGLDTAHEAFQNDPEGAAWNLDTIKGFTANNTLNAVKTDGNAATAEELYKSAKIPFAFDYADRDLEVLGSSNHGTHVAGSVGADNDELSGVAPDTQLVIMKVFSDLSEGADDSWIFAALEDAVVLGVDTINMSLGSASGFTTDAESDEVYNRVMDAGISLMCAAGNDTDSVNSTNLGVNLPLVSEPDSSIVGSPSTFNAAVSVASVNENRTFSQYLLSNDKHIIFSDSNAGTAMDFVASLDGQTLEYVPVPGFGSETDFEQVDVEGKIALVSRGEIAFTEKETNAQKHGAAAMLVFDNADGELSSMQTGGLIPMVMITKEDGRILRKQENKTISVSSDYAEYTTTPESGKMSDFSSLGVAPDLTLKPEITAPGGNVYSTLPGNTYGNMNGTSMASPHMAGAASVVRQYVDEKFPDMSKTDQRKLINTLILNTAVPVTDHSDVPVTPRKQGAGLAQIYNAIHTPVYAEVEGSEKPKAELKDSPNGYFSKKFTVKLHNMSDQDAVYTPEATPLVAKTEEVSANGQTYLCISNDSRILPANEFQVSFSKDTITVPANGEAVLEVSMVLTKEGEKALEVFENGIFMDGFITLSAQGEDGINLNIPYLGYYGDWGQPSVFDDQMYDDEEASVYASNLGIIDISDGRGYYLGMNLLDSEETLKPDSDKIAIASRSLQYNRPFSMMGLLRAPEVLTTRIYNEDGKQVYEYVANHPTKSYYYGNGGFVSYDLGPGNTGWAPIFEDEEGMVNYLPDGTYKWEMTAEVAGSTSAKAIQKDSFPITIDNQAPQLLGTRYEVIDGTPYVIATVTDNHYAMGMQLISKDESEAYTGAVLIDEDHRNAETEVAFDVSDLQADGIKTAKLIIYDYALNQTISDTFSVVSNDVQPESIRINNRDITWTGGGTEEISVFIEPDNAANQEITWTSSNESVAKCVATDRIDELGGHVSILTVYNVNGTAQLTATTPNGLSDTITVTASARTSELPENLMITENGAYQLPENLTNKTIKIADGVTSVTLIGHENRTADNPYEKVSVQALGANLSLNIQDLHVAMKNFPSNPGIQFTGEGNILNLVGENSYYSDNDSYYSKALIQVDENTELTINGKGTLNLSNGTSTYGAAIGGAPGHSPKSITINEGNLNITVAGEGAGIGGGSTAGAGEINIHGGNISLSSPIVHGAYRSNLNDAGAGIGDGYQGSKGSSKITVDGGTITGETWNSSAVVGSGYRSSAPMQIAVSGGKLDVKAHLIEDSSASAINDGTAALGAGSNTSGTASINISGGEIIAESDGRAPAMGGGMNSKAPSIVVSGGTITAKSTYIGQTAIGADNKYATSAYMQVTGGSIKATAVDAAAINVSSLINDDYENVYKTVIANAKPGHVTVDGVDWNIPANHPEDENFYLYLTDQNHTIHMEDEDSEANYEVVFDNNKQAIVKAYQPVTTSLEGLSWTGPARIYEGQDLEGQISLTDPETTRLPVSVSVTAGGQPVEAEYNPETGLIRVAAADIAGPVVVEAAAALATDKAALTAHIEQADALSEESYTPSTWATLLTALQAAKETAANEQASQDAVNAADEALAGAIEALTPRADLSELNAAIAEAEKYAASDYKTFGWAEFEQALQNARNTAADKEASSEKAAEAASALTAAMNALQHAAEKDALRHALEEAAALFKTNYTEESWTESNIEACVDQAAALLTNQDASQEDVDAAEAALRKAINKLTDRRDFSGLQSAVESADALDSDSYTPDSWAPVEAALEQAKAVLENPDSAQNEIDEALAALQSAVDNLQERADTSALKDLIDQAAGLNENDWTPDSWNEAGIPAAIEAAQAAADNANASQQEIDDAAAMLQNAVNKLVSRADYSALNEAIKAAEAVNTDALTPASKALLESMLAEAKETAANLNADQDSVDAAVVRLHDAMDHLKTAADFSALNALIAENENRVPGEYTEDSWNAFSEAMNAAKETAADPEADQETVNAAAAALQEAAAALVKATDFSELNALIAAGEERNAEDYTEETWKVFAEALASAKETAANTKATQDEVDDAAKALGEAAAQLKMPVSKEELLRLINEAKAKDEKAHTPNSWAAAKLEDALDHAQTVYDKADASEEEVKAAEESLNKALQALIRKADKSALGLALIDSSKLEEENYTPASWSEHQKAYKKANGVAADENASQEEVDAAHKALKDAKDALVDHSGIKKTLEKASGLKEADYTVSSWKSLTEAKDAAQKAVNDGNASQKDLDAKNTALVKAMDSLKKPGDASELNKEIESASKLKLSDYTDASAKKIEAALKEAKAAVADKADQETLNARLKSLQQAVKDAQKKSAASNGNTGTKKGSSSSTAARMNSGWAVMTAAAGAALAGLLRRRRK